MKKKEGFENAKFYAVFKSLICSDREKGKANYHFPSIVKNNGKEGWTISKVRKEKLVAQIFRKDLTERKLEKTRMKIMLSASSSLFFFTVSLQYQIWKTNMYFNLTNDNWTLTASFGVLN